MSVFSGNRRFAILYIARSVSSLTLLGLALLFFFASTENAEARKRHYRGHRQHAVISTRYVKRAHYTPPYAEMVYDVNAGKILASVNADSLRHPASITKVMTLYLLFEQLERGKFSLDSELDVSAHAASQSPSKLGLRPGSTIEVEDAIKALVTKSANDVAVTIGESIAGSEDAFAEMMTRKARAIGMKSTVFRNASGLPDSEQVTTARDLVVLGRAIQDRFPKYYKYFATRSFAFRGYSIGNHNRLLGRVEGVDGIKTGYTRASGFNLLTSAKLDGHHVIAVVLGGRSGRARDNKVAAMIDEHLPNSSTSSRRNTQVAELEREVEPPARPQTGNIVQKTAAATKEVAIAAPIAIKPSEKPKPAVVAELPRSEPPKAKSEIPAQSAINGQPIQLRPNLSGTTPVRIGAAPSVTASTTPSGPTLRWVKGSAPKTLADVDPRVGQPTEPSARKALGLRADAYSETDSAITTATVPTRNQTETITKDVAKTELPKVSGRSGWIIQLAATDDEAKALAILSNAKSKNRTILASAESFTEKVQKGASTLYRARFAGFAGNEAEAACKALKRTGYACFAQHI